MYGWFPPSLILSTAFKFLLCFSIFYFILLCFLSIVRRSADLLLFAFPQSPRAPLQDPLLLILQMAEAECRKERSVCHMQDSTRAWDPHAAALGSSYCCNAWHIQDQQPWILQIQPISTFTECSQSLAFVLRQFDASFVFYFPMFLLVLTKDCKNEVVEISCSQSKSAKCSTTHSRSIIVLFIRLYQNRFKQLFLVRNGWGQVIGLGSFYFYFYFLCCIW